MTIKCIDLVSRFTQVKVRFWSSLAEGLRFTSTRIEKVSRGMYILSTWYCTSQYLHVNPLPEAFPPVAHTVFKLNIFSDRLIACRISLLSTGRHDGSALAIRN